MVNSLWVYLETDRPPVFGKENAQGTGNAWKAFCSVPGIFLWGENMDNTILRVENINFAYKKRQVLNGISFSVKAGCFCALLGPNGSGKTTLLKCINQILFQDSGNILLDGQTASSLGRRDIARLVAMVPQQTHLVFGFSVMELVVMGRSSSLGTTGLPGRQDYHRAQTALEELGISHLAQRKFNELSGGERQLVLLARALCQEPRILLLDEPTSHLDFKNQFLILNKVRGLTRDRGLASLISIHDPNQAARYCDSVVMLKDGAVLKQGLVQEVFQPLSLAELYGMEVVVQRSSTGSDFVLPRYY